jgi:hypothetical protein
VICYPAHQFRLLARNIRNQYFPCRTWDLGDGAGKSDYRAGAETGAGDGGGAQARVRDRLALLLTYWAGMRVCEVAALIRDTVLGPAGEILEEWRLDRDQTKGSMGRVVYANSKLRKEVAAYLTANSRTRSQLPGAGEPEGQWQALGFRSQCALPAD